MAAEPSLSPEVVEHRVLASWRRLLLIDRAQDDAALVRHFTSSLPEKETTDESRPPDLTLGSLFGWIFAGDTPHGGLAFLAEPHGSTEKVDLWRALAKPLVRAVKAQDRAWPRYEQFIHHPPPVESVKMMPPSST